MPPSKKKPTKSKRALGTGLSALMGEVSTVVQSTKQVDVTAAQADSVNQVLPIETLHPNPSQPRRNFSEESLSELARSVTVSGILQPILVRPSSTHKGGYEIIAGERRWRAAQRSGLHEVPVRVCNLDDVTTLQVALVENLQRSDLNPVEEARGYQRLTDEYNHTANEIAEFVGKSRSHIANSIRLLKLPKPVLVYLEQGELTPGHVRPLIGRADATAQAKKMIQEGLTARDAERIGRSGTRKRQHGATGTSTKSADTIALEGSLSAALGFTVRIVDQGGRGDVRISFANYEELDKINSSLTGETLA